VNTRNRYPFEKLLVWQAARELAKAICLTTSAFPQREVYGLTSPCHRAAVSVVANLAKGGSRQSRKDQAHFSEIAYGSLMELPCLLILGKDIGILAADTEETLRRSIEDV
jgi:four helix bundle protein